jgi:hypothetical protein
VSEPQRKVAIYLRVPGPKGGAGGSGVAIEQPSTAEAIAELRALLGPEEGPAILRGLIHDLGAAWVRDEPQNEGHA